MIIWITGCTSGLGKALAMRYCDDGHTVVGGGRNEEALEELRSGFPRGHFLRLDVGDESSVESFCGQARELTGAPDYLINNAGVMNKPARLWEVSGEEFGKLTNININGVAHMIRHVVPFMLEVKRGIVVNLSSGLGKRGMSNVAPYCASKHAVEGLSSAVALEFSEISSELACIALSPGVINTSMLQKNLGEGASEHQTADDWVEKAAPYILGLHFSNNGDSLRVPD
ncbi:MAG: SDR family oxidoreductase [Akkermansiaceae bacterium]